MHRKPTMNDVARLAGVGTMTVSRVLNDSARVTTETAQRVHRAIQELNYRPNELARALRGQRSRTIGLILPYLYDPFFAVCAHAVTTVAKGQGYTVILTQSEEDAAVEAAEASLLIQRHVEGLLVIPASSGKSRLASELLGNIPVVAFDRPLPDPAVDSVLIDNHSGSNRMVRHLIEHGHRKILFVGLNQQIFTIDARYQGYRSAMADAGLEPSAFLGCAGPEEVLRLLDGQLKGNDPPTAFFTSNTLVTRYVMTALFALGIKIPGDAALAAFDDFDFAELLTPSVTVVRQPMREMGRAAAGQLFERLRRGDDAPRASRIVLPVEMVLRESCGCSNRAPVV